MLNLESRSPATVLATAQEKQTRELTLARGNVRRTLGALVAGALRSARIAVCASLLLGCASAGQFVWFKDLPKTEWGAATGDYVIGVGDVINIRVYEQEGLSGSVKV